MKLNIFTLSFVLFLSPLLLTGCWNIREIQDINYVTALGIDYVNHRYVAYAQMLDFSNVAKTEGGGPTKQPPISIGKGEGITMTTALNNLYRDAQQRVFWGHVSSLLLSERVLEKGIDESIDFINRYREIRYNILLFATKEPIEDIFRAKSFFTLSSLSTLIHEPTENYRQRSYVKPIQFFEFISDIHEPGQTGYVPAIRLSKEHWKADKKPQELLEINGAFFIRNNHLQGWLPESKLDGMRWMNPHSVRSPVWILEGEKPVASLVIEKPEIKVETIIKRKIVYFDIYVNVKGGINEKLTELPENELIHQAEETIKKEIVETFEEGRNMQADIYKLGLLLYRQHPRIWHNIIKRNTFFLDKDSIQTVKVELKLVNSGKLKYEEK